MPARAATSFCIVSLLASNDGCPGISRPDAD
jgi:hypothetical protein